METKSESGTYKAPGIDALENQTPQDTESDELTLIKRVESLKWRADDIEQKFDRLERNMSWVIAALAVGLILGFIALLTTVILVGMDYLHGNEKLDDFGNTHYTKIESDQKLSDFKKCLAAGGWQSCLVQ